MNRNVFTIFSDDVRQEIGGKVSYIGCYSGELLVADFPAVLSKLCLSLAICTPGENPFKSIVAKLYRDDEIIASAVMTEEQIHESCPPDFISPQANGIGVAQTVHLGFSLSPFVIDSPCMLRVRVETESEELKGLGLRINRATEKQLSSMPQ